MASSSAGTSLASSIDLAAEVPALLEAITGRLGSIERVSYNLGGWASASRRVDAGGIRVRLDGLRTRPSDTIDVSGVNDHRVTLLVIPPTPTSPLHGTSCGVPAPRETARATDTLLGNG